MICGTRTILYIHMHARMHTHAHAALKLSPYSKCRCVHMPKYIIHWPLSVISSFSLVFKMYCTKTNKYVFENKALIFSICAQAVSPASPQCFITVFFLTLIFPLMLLENLFINREFSFIKIFGNVFYMSWS
jgi:hypothetical protein